MAAVLSAVLLVAGVVLTLVVHLLLVFWALRRFYRVVRSRLDEARAAGAGLSRGELEKLPCYDYNGGGGEAGCAVCLEGLEAGERCRRLPRCGHSFHAQCVDSWLQKSRMCPVCRAEVAGRRAAAVQSETSEGSGGCRIFREGRHKVAKRKNKNLP